MQRSRYMQNLIRDNYSLTLTEAVYHGFDGAMERVLAQALERELAAGNSEAEVIVQAAGGNCLNAAYLITSLQNPDYAQGLPL